MPRFFKTLGNLCNLEVLHFPRTSCHSSSEVNSLIWPPRLRELHMIGNLDYSGLPPLNNFPPSLTYLSLRKCRLEMPFIDAIIEKLSPQLLHFRYGNDMSHLYEGHLDGILKKLPSVQRLSIPIQQISTRFFSYSFELNSSTPTQIVELELTSNVYATDQNDDIDIDVIWDAVLDGGLGRLRILRIHQDLGWPRSNLELTDLKLFSEMLQALAREDGERATVSEDKAGVYIFS